jgi:F-type H+-transporting ATPase subunit delta
MDLNLIARRYVEAFVDYVKHTIGLEQAIKEFKTLEKIMQDNPELNEILTSPAISDAERYEFIDTVLKPHFSNEVFQLLDLLVEKERISLLPDMVKHFLDTYAPADTVEVTVKSARPLEKDVMKALEAKLAKRLDKKPVLAVKVDPGIIGGLRLEIGNTVIDGSIRGRLEALARGF